ncbi:branched-chain amino acid ABC transporter permease [Pigmentiphaga aceris]|uniref:Branched-chain amino acid ABC transporter permease n=1 Tax=Pigmentiphaga aceris TaxID=1940612 RepID=A0A5C0B5N7_9BURK|nr:branched-chain amino acid ABC transporter permease [Pigmentiphaga aceris]
MRGIAPMLVSLGAWGVVAGVAMAKVGLGLWLSLAMSMLVFAGSAQLTALPLIAAGAPIWLIFGAVFIVNLRFVIFGAVLHPFFRHYSPGRRIFLGFVNTDASFIKFMADHNHLNGPALRSQTWYFVGSGVICWLMWQTSTVVGVLLGSAIPSSWSVEFAAVLALIAMLVPMCAARPALLAVVVASFVSWLTQPLPLRVGLLLAVIAGIVAGYWADVRIERLKQQEGRP